MHARMYCDAADRVERVYVQIAGRKKSGFAAWFYRHLNFRALLFWMMHAPGESTGPPRLRRRQQVSRGLARRAPQARSASDRVHAQGAAGPPQGAHQVRVEQYQGAVEGLEGMSNILLLCKRKPWKTAGNTSAFFPPILLIVRISRKLHILGCLWLFVWAV